MAKAPKRPQTAAEKLGEKLIIGSMILGAVSLLVVTGSHDKATATEPQQSTTTTVVVSSADSIPPLAINAAETPAPVVHQSASKPKTTSAPTTAKPKVDDAPIVIVWNFPTCQHPDPAKVDAIEKMQGPFTPAQVKKFVGCPA